MIKKFLQKIFKKITYFFFFKIYGKIEKSIKHNEDKRIKVEIIDINKELKYKIYKVNNGRLYTDRIHDTAVILENKIIEGPSFQLRGNNNSLISNNIVFEKGTARKLKNLKGSVLSLLTGGGANNNYWHWLYDVLPRFKLCEYVKKLEEIDYFILPSLKRNFQKETLKELKINEKKTLSSEKFRHVKANELIVTDHPYILTNDFHKDAQNIPDWIIQWLKEKFLLNLKILKKNYPKYIYLDRSDTKSSSGEVRSLINEDKIKNYLSEKNFTFIELEKLSFIEQIHYFNNAEYIIGLHGAGFANLTFCKSNTKVIEFRMDNTGKVIENLAIKNNLRFKSIIRNTKIPYLGKQSGHIEIPLNILEEKMYDLKNE